MQNNSIQRFSSGAPWESIVGYSRAVRHGQIIEVSGTCAVDEQGAPFAPDDAYLQTRRVLEIIQQAVEGLGGRMEDVLRTRIYVTRIDLWEEIGRAHGEFFSHIRPATTMVEVSRLIAPEFLVEIEASAIANT